MILHVKAVDAHPMQEMAGLRWTGSEIVRVRLHTSLRITKLVRCMTMLRHTSLCGAGQCSGTQACAVQDKAQAHKLVRCRTMLRHTHMRVGVGRGPPPEQSTTKTLRTANNQFLKAKCVVFTHKASSWRLSERPISKSISGIRIVQSGAL